MLHQKSLEYQPNERTERVESVEIRHIRGDIARIEFVLAQATSVVELQAWTGLVNPTANAEEPFRALRRRLLAAVFLVGIAALSVYAWFVSRHNYFAQSEMATYVLGLALLLPATMLWPVVYAAFPRRRAGVLFLVATPAVLVAMLQASIVIATAPSVERAVQLRQSGEPLLALREAAATAEFDSSNADAKRVHDAIQIEILDQLADPSTRWKGLGAAEFYTDDARTSAQSRALEATAAVAADLQRRGEYVQSLTMLQSVPAAFQNAPALQDLTSAAHAHEIAVLWRVIQSKSSLAERLDACRRADRPLLALGSTSARVLAVPREQVQRTCDAVRAQEAARIKTQEQAARTAALMAERDAAAAERRFQQATRVWQTAPLECRDGTDSSTCVCGQTSRRGCCSGHGGVAGCSQPMPER